MLLLTAQVVNIRVKASMHLAFHTFLGVLILYFNKNAGLGFLLFAPLLAWSRLHLKRHVKKEIFAGVALGAAFGMVFWLLS
jgi:PAP2 superfamily.